MDYGKEAGAESRFKQWTSMIDGLPSSVSQDVSLHKNGTVRLFCSIACQIDCIARNVLKVQPKFHKSWDAA